MPDVIRIGTRIFSWESLIFTIDGQPFEGLNSFDLEQKRERKVYWGARRDGTPLGKTSGKYSVSGCSMKMLIDSYDALTDYLSLQGLGSYGDAEFTIGIQAVEEVTNVPISIAVASCTIDGEKDSWAEGVDEAAVEVTIGALWAKSNGKQLWSLVRSL